jgi:hypothetical protein
MNQHVDLIGPIKSKPHFMNGYLKRLVINFVKSLGREVSYMLRSIISFIIFMNVILI